MSIETELQTLVGPIAANAPCGPDPEDSFLLASFNTYRVFGLLEPPSVTGPDGKPKAPDWREIKQKALDALGVSRDLRYLGYFAVAALRVDGWSGFLGSLKVAAGWLKDYWAQVYPPVDDDAMLRKNALNYFADRMAVLDFIRRLPIVENRALGRVSLRDVEIATNQRPASESDVDPVTESQISGVFIATSTESLNASKTPIDAAIRHLNEIDSAMRDFGGAAASPDFEPLTRLLGQVQKLLADQLSARGAMEGSVGQLAVDPAGAVEAATVGGTVGAIRSRVDAKRALDSIADFFRHTEPSSPVPLFIDRAKNLIGKDFLEVLENVAPEGVASARHAGGLKDA
jgi:type VI secretion system protein ImpA